MHFRNVHFDDATKQLFPEGFGPMELDLLTVDSNTKFGLNLDRWHGEGPERPDEYMGLRLLNRTRDGRTVGTAIVLESHATFVFVLADRERIVIVQNRLTDAQGPPGWYALKHTSNPEGRYLGFPDAKSAYDELFRR